MNGPEGSPIVTREFTSLGEVSLVRYYDANRNGMAVGGAYGIMREYNAYGNLETETWLGQDGNPAANEEGFARIFYDYDLSNITDVEKYYQYYQDAAGEPTAAENGAWGMTMLFYPITRIHEVTYIGQDHKPMMTADHYAIYKYETDENGNQSWEGYFDELDAPTDNAAGYSTVTREFDSEGRLIGERYQDRYNKLANNEEGVASWNGYYDEEGNLVVTNRYDKDLQPVEIP